MIEDELKCYLLLDEARVHDVHDPVDGERGLGNIGRNHDLPCAGRRRVEDTRLHFGGQGAVHRQDDQLGDLRKRISQCLNVLHDL